jgi:serine/threonine protein kinase
MCKKAKNNHGNLCIPLQRRVRLACQIALSVLYVHSGHFVHKHIKPENIVIFESQSSPAHFPAEIGRPFLVGFDRSRFVTGHTNRLGDVAIEDFIYQHPERWNETVETRFTMLHDIYSLGVVLLEIGLWEPFVSEDINGIARTRLIWKGFKKLFDDGRFKENRGPSDVQDMFVKCAESMLPAKLGQRYAKVVTNCLKGDIFEKDSLIEKAEMNTGIFYVKEIIAKLEEIQV